MKKASIIMAVLSCAIIAVAYTNSVPISTNTRAATEKWTAIRFEPALPPTPENAASKFLDGNREWQTVAAEADLAALRAYHYGSPDIVESPAEWFVLDGAGTITAFNWSEGRENVVIPWAIDGVPVTAIGADAFQFSGIVSVVAPQTVTTIGSQAFNSCASLASVSLQQATSIGDSAFYYCFTLTSVNLPQATSIGNNAFYRCEGLGLVNLPQATSIGDSAFYRCEGLGSVNLLQATSIGDSAFYNCFTLTSVNLPQATSIGNNAFYRCEGLGLVNLPQATSIGDSAFSSCYFLTAVRMGQNAPAEAASVFEYITPPTVYVTDPQATGWGAEWNGAPVVRPPLYGSHVTAQAFTLNGDTITEWPSGGGGETSIIAPLYESGTNVTVTSTQSVYSVAVTGAGPVGIDWSGLALDGTGRAGVTLRLNVTEWGGTNVTFSPAMTFDRTPEILVTGVWEFAASTIDGVTTRVSQTWPACCGWQPVVITVAGVSSVVGTWWQMPDAATNYVYWQAVNRAGLVQMRLNVISAYAVDVNLYSSYAAAGNTTFSALDVFQSKTLSFPYNSPGEYTVSIAVPQPVYPNRGVKIWVAPVGEGIRIYNLKHRDFNSNERAAYAAGWRP